MKPNPHRGSDFDDFLKSEGIYASPKLKKAIKDLSDSIQAREREAFAAGWDAFIERHPSFLISHSITDTRAGLEDAWKKFRDQSKETTRPKRPEP